jgi:hypothetical protein
MNLANQQYTRLTPTASAPQAAAHVANGHHPYANSPRQLAQAARIAQLRAAAAAAPKAASTASTHGGLPQGLRSGIEAISGVDMSGVRVHRNSDKPAQLNAHAYAQGQDIHLGPGQEKHLAHEAWHVVQQAQGRVKPTMQMAGAVAVNADASLEREADVMGRHAVAGGMVQRSLMERIVAPAYGGNFVPAGSAQFRPRQGKLHIQPSGSPPSQLMVDVKAHQQQGQVTISATGKAKDFSDGSDAGDNGWNGVEFYRVSAKVGTQAIEPKFLFNNKYLVAQSGHVLAAQNGGDGSDPNNVFAQDGGMNNGPFRSMFENPMRDELKEAVSNDINTNAKFSAILYGKNISQGKLSKVSKDAFLPIKKEPNQSTDLETKCACD